MTTSPSLTATLFHNIAPAAGNIAHFPNRTKGILHPDMPRCTGVLNAWSCPRTGDGGDEPGSQEPAYPGGRENAAPKDDTRPTLPIGKAVSGALSVNSPRGTLSLSHCPQTSGSPCWNADRSFRRQVRHNVCTGNPGLRTHENEIGSQRPSPCDTSPEGDKLSQAGGSGGGNTREMQRAARVANTCGDSAALKQLCPSFVGPMILPRLTDDAPEPGEREERRRAEYLHLGTVRTPEAVRAPSTDGIARDLLPQAVTAARRAQCGVYGTNSSTRDTLASTDRQPIPDASSRCNIDEVAHARKPTKKMKWKKGRASRPMNRHRAKTTYHLRRLRFLPI